MTQCPRCGFAIGKAVPFICPRCHAMFNMPGVVRREVASIADAIAGLDDADAFARTQMRWVLRSLGAPAVDALVAEHARNPREATRGALVFLGHGEAPEQTEELVPYLGEAIVFDEEEELGDDESIWIAIVEAERYLNEEDPGAGEAWEPDRLVLGRSRLTLVSYDWDGEREVGREIAAAGNAFTMGEVLRAAHRMHVDLAHAPGPRIFEGITRLDDGTYRIRTGS